MSNSGDIVPNDAAHPPSGSSTPAPCACHLVQQRDQPGITVDNVGTIDVHQRRAQRVRRRHLAGPVTDHRRRLPSSTLVGRRRLGPPRHLDLTGDGVMRLSGTLQPKTAPLSSASPPTGCQLDGTLDGSVQPIRNTGVLPLDDDTIIGDATAGLGLTNARRRRSSPERPGRPRRRRHRQQRGPLDHVRRRRHRAQRCVRTRRAVRQHRHPARPRSFSNEINAGITVDNVGTIDVHQRRAQRVRRRDLAGPVTDHRRRRRARPSSVDGASDLHGTWSSPATASCACPAPCNRRPPR